MKMAYTAWINRAAGLGGVVEGAEASSAIDWYHCEPIGTFGSREEANAALLAQKGEEVFAVFWNNAAMEGFVSAEDNLSGNWRGSKHSPYRVYGEYETEKEAEEALLLLLA